jgi:hypothetical protein
LPDRTEPPVLLIDAHVHVHECYAWDALLDHASANFAAAARSNGWGSPTGVLMLTESHRVDRFGEIAAKAEPARKTAVGGWTVERTLDPCALLARAGGGALVLVAGRQVVTRERLEVLLLGTRALVADGQPVREVLALGQQLGALRVIPWGVGKWLLARGRLLRGLIEEARPDSGFFLGDSGGRPFFWAGPGHFAQAAARGIRVLPGTDPLPFPAEVSRPGSYGFRLGASADLTLPAEGIKSALLRTDTRLTPFGALERLFPFLRNQLAMQRRKRQRG